MHIADDVLAFCLLKVQRVRVLNIYNEAVIICIYYTHILYLFLMQLVSSLCFARCVREYESVYHFPMRVDKI